MNNTIKNTSFADLLENFKGEFHQDYATRLLYATDASAYKVLPQAVAFPKDENDLKIMIHLANANNTSLIPRTAGTSLAGQVVGDGIVVDISKYFTKILDINPEEKWVKVQPGVILDELNHYLKDFGLFFGPETSTSSRCMMGGMLGNNSCGSHSIIYGSTRDHTLEVKALLSDGSEAIFKSIATNEFQEKCQDETQEENLTLETRLYRQIREILKNPENQRSIRSEFPDPLLPRRNTGYALDVLLESEPFTENASPFNFCNLIAGSEGTLALATEIKLNLVPAPPKEKAVVCAHFETLEESLQGNIIALKHNPGAVELMDNQILKLTEGNLLQNRNRFFVKGQPGAILIIEFARETRDEIQNIADALTADMKKAKLGYHFPVIFGTENIARVWALRKAALGVLSNMAGDAKPVSVIEDTAVHPNALPEYIREVKALLKEQKLECVYHAHVGSGEIHLRPILNLKAKEDVERFHQVAKASAQLVKKHRGSLSGEHGDGRLRGEFIPLMIGEHNYQLLKEIKKTWDPNGIFNPGKITDTPKMNTHLRYEPGAETRNISTIFDFTKDMGILRATERCNGSGDCRNTSKTGKAMCPSYQASLDERTTTRARANTFREFLTNSNKLNPFDHKELYDVLDLCLSCKACKSECPSSVDMAKLKAEFLQHYYDTNGVPLRAKMIANISKLNRLGSLVPSLYNFVNQNKLSGKLLKKSLGFATERSLPKLSNTTLRRWVKNNTEQLRPNPTVKGKVHFFADEFTNYNDTSIGITAIKLLTRLGYQVIVPDHVESGRTYLSKGLVREAQKLANQNISLLCNIVTEEVPLIGIEPSAILTFRDEYPELVRKDLRTEAKALAPNALMIEEFLWQEMEKGNISKDQFTEKEKEVKFHGHCYQKSLASTQPTQQVLSFPRNYTAVEIPSGCCGMAGSFGYEKEHYALSMKVGELVLLPEIRKTPEQTLIAASGTSCRHQIKDGAHREAKHPVEILYEALIN
ncbi:MAG: FAD-binding and (Fe-S)-binding domain-containing protein [Marinifilaceae bacterium]